MTRRELLSLPAIGALVVLAAKAKANAKTPVPVIWGDGYHDDGPGLDAWGAGKPCIDRYGNPMGRELKGMRLWRREFNAQKALLTITRQDQYNVTDCVFYYPSVAVDA